MTKKRVSRKRELIHIVKRHGTLEHFDSKKVYASAYAAALNAHLSERKAETIAFYVQKHIAKWVRPRKEVTSAEIRDEITAFLKTINEDVAMLYETHLDVN